MKKLWMQLAAFSRDESGAAASEYAILLALITIVAGSVLALGDALANKLSDAADCVEVGCI